MKILLIAGISLIASAVCIVNAKAQTVSSLKGGIAVSLPGTQSLVSFGAAKSEGSALISWKIKNETGGTVFDVEKSIDTGKTFMMAGTVWANGSEVYSFTDHNPATGQDQYRLKIQDGDGHNSYSNALILPFQPISAASAKIRLNPKPVNSIDMDTASDDNSLDLSPVSKQYTFNIK